VEHGGLPAPSTDRVYRRPLGEEARRTFRVYAPARLSQNRCDKCSEGLGKLLS
jgi:hypothetical protein